VQVVEVLVVEVPVVEMSVSLLPIFMVPSCSLTSNWPPMPMRSILMFRFMLVCLVVCLVAVGGEYVLACVGVRPDCITTNTMRSWTYAF
jgi:hypothetical protein